jgi:predicted GNAT family acetyltransferase
MADDEIVIRDNPEKQRYEALVKGAVAGFVDYRDRGRRIFVHTEVDKAYGGRGIGNRLAAGALDLAREAGLRVVPRCPFIRAFIARHPEYRSAL